MKIMTTKLDNLNNKTKRKNWQKHKVKPYLKIKYKSC